MNVDTIIEKVFELHFINELVPAIFSLAFVAIKNVYVTANSKRKKQYEFISSFFAKDINSRNKIEVEHAFWHYLGNRYDYKEIQLILDTEQPLANFFLLDAARRYIEMNKCGEPYQLTYKSNFETPSSRKLWNLLFWFIYLICSYFGIWLLLYSYHIFAAKGPAVYALAVVIIFAFLSLAYVGFKGASGLQSAKQLLRNLTRQENQLGIGGGHREIKKVLRGHLLASGCQ